MMASSLEIELGDYSDPLALLTMELSTDDIETLEEVPADSWIQLAGKVNGNIGMFFGFSLFRLSYTK